ncbi:hypothetical protein FDP41_009765 [Naegleria fowleri]|uniref:Aminoglycoside phosphotransferase domain-containing protein n=1 Tax=Naegleria fowleri TaxID=5763 RepID=A0A6A5BGA7_NAEFO|nr:uncharacterized protein FDP41_009765 [Naegleria fowleri]KAF0972069.1 hypothetical protein FDP41_009765 [Naegleria fowleri]CAG4718604.1 unnamed protein product [Naegleria fowleri]
MPLNDVTPISRLVRDEIFGGDDDDEISESEATCSSDREYSWNSETILEILRKDFPHIMQPNTHLISQLNLPVEKVLEWNCVVSCDELTGGVENDSVKVAISFSANHNDKVIELPTQYYVFRIYNDQEKTKEYIKFELCTLFFLGQNSFPVPFVILPTAELVAFVQSNYSKFPDMEKAVLEYVDGRLCALFSYVHGFHVDKGKKTVNQVTQISMFLGSLHKLTQFNGYSMLDMKATIQDMVQMRSGVTKLTFSYITEAMQSVMEEIQTLKSQVITLTQENFPNKGYSQEKIDHANRYNNKVLSLLDNLKNILESNVKDLNIIELTEKELLLPHSIVHADIHENNVLFTKSQDNQDVISGVVDWDDSQYGPQILDFIKGFIFWCISKVVTPDVDYNEFDLFDDDLIRIYKSTYEHYRGFPISEEEKNLMIPYSHLIICAQVDFFIHALNAEELFVLPNHNLHEWEDKNFEPFCALTWFNRICRELVKKIELILK